jgi:hypothetical protein
MKLVKQAVTLFGTVLFVAMVATLLAPKTAHAVVSALVTVANTSSNPVPTQQVIPSQPFFARILPSTGLFDPRGDNSVGPGSSGRLAVTNISISNLSTSSGAQEVNIFAAILSPGSTSCGAVTGVGDVYVALMVPQGQTLTVSYPTPLVFTPVNGVSCVAVEGFVESGLEVYVTGFVQ